MNEKVKALLKEGNEALWQAKQDLRKAMLAVEKASAKVKCLRKQLKKPPQRLQYKIYPNREDENPRWELYITSKCRRRERIIGRADSRLDCGKMARQWQREGKQASGCLLLIRDGRNPRDGAIILYDRNFPGLAKLIRKQDNLCPPKVDAPLQAAA